MNHFKILTGCLSAAIVMSLWAGYKKGETDKGLHTHKGDRAAPSTISDSNTDIDALDAVSESSKGIQEHPCSSCVSCTNTEHGGQTQNTASHTLRTLSPGQAGTYATGDYVTVRIDKNRNENGRINKAAPFDESIYVIEGRIPSMNNALFYTTFMDDGRIVTEIFDYDNQSGHVIVEQTNGSISSEIKPLSQMSTVCHPFNNTDGQIDADAADVTEGTSDGETASAIVPSLSSKPGSEYVLYLDFNGETVTDSYWTNNAKRKAGYGNPGDPLDISPFNISGSADTFTNSELERIYIAWNEVAEDFAPFDINVTTDRSAYDAADTSKRHHNIITSTKWYPAGGVASFYSFGVTSAPGINRVSWTFNSSQSSLGGTISHETGHTLGLSHDGIPGDTYYNGHGMPNNVDSWSTIMGSGFTYERKTWSKGEYYNANNTQDDFSIMQGYINYREDDHSDGIGNSASTLNSPTDTRHYKIHAGKFYRGDFSKVFFVNEQAVGSPSPAVSTLSNLVIYEEGSPVPDPIIFLDHIPSDYGSIPSTGSLVINPLTNITLTGTNWKAIDYPYTITDKTIIEFDFSSDVMGDIHAIGFDTNNTTSPGYAFQLHGSDTWGMNRFYENGVHSYNYTHRLHRKGIIEDQNDADVFQYTSIGGEFQLTVDVAYYGNLKPKLELLDNNGLLLATADASDELNATLNRVGIAGESYYIRVSGTGVGLPFSNPPSGYTDYGSVGNYTVFLSDTDNNDYGPIAVDSDGDGLSDNAEINTYGTDPNNPDTDNDGLSDGDEIRIYGTGALALDSDNDGVNDGSEVNIHGTHPMEFDSDGDGLSDGVEINTHNTNPLSQDTDGDEIDDGTELNVHGTDPLIMDTDGDKFHDGIEIFAGTDPLDPNSYPTGPPAGKMYASGRNTYGQLGDGTTTLQSPPIEIRDMVHTVTGGNGFSLYITVDKRLWGVGHNTYGQLGNGTTDTQYTPILISNDVIYADASKYGSYYIKSDNTLWAAGRNSYGQLGTGDEVDYHTHVQVAQDVAMVEARHRHLLYTKTDGTLWGVGYNGQGQLGIGNYSNTITHTLIDNDVAKMASGYYHSIYVKNDGSAWVMGYNSVGQLGTGGGTYENAPVNIANDVIDVAASDYNIYYVKSDNTLWASGRDNYGELGDGGASANAATPVQIANDAITVFGGTWSAAYINTSDQLYGWGYNGWRQLSSESSDNQFAPVHIADTVTTATQGDYHLLYVNAITVEPNVDSDGDGITDSDEINIYGTDPNKADTDGDLIDDYHEILAGLDPLLSDDKLLGFIRNNAPRFGLRRTDTVYYKLYAGNVVHQNGKIKIDFHLNRSENLKDWTVTQTELFERDFSSDQKFYRVRLEDTRAQSDMIGTSDSDSDGIPDADEINMGMNPNTDDSAYIQKFKTIAPLILAMEEVDYSGNPDFPIEQHVTSGYGFNNTLIVEESDDLTTWSVSENINFSPIEMGFEHIRIQTTR